MNVLVGHNSEENGYVVHNYPYGGRRTDIRYWIEYKLITKIHSWRFCSQTLNPKTNRWNAPKCSTYVDKPLLMGINPENNHVERIDTPYNDKISDLKVFYQTYSNYFNLEQLEAFRAYFIGKVARINKADMWDKCYKGEIPFAEHSRAVTLEYISLNNLVKADGLDEFVETV